MERIKEFISKHKTLSVVIFSFLTLTMVFILALADIFTSTTNNQTDKEIFIYPNTDYACLCSNLEKKNIVKTDNLSFVLLSKLFSFDKSFKAGYYIVEKNTPIYKLVRKIRNGEQTAVKISINNMRTADIFAEKVAKKFLFSKQDMQKTIDSLQYIYPNELFYSIIPDTYEFYWTTKPKDLLRKLFDFSEKWWQKKENAIKTSGYSREDIIVLSSIVQEETTKQDEKSRIAGVYINRLKNDMLLQADPTVKFAYGDFTLKRIRLEHLRTDSPFNTYKYKGLPPAPICLPDVSTIEAVLNHEKHSYLYFCAKEDFSGYHNFASTVAEHNINAKKYHSALNRRNIR